MPNNKTFISQVEDRYTDASDAERFTRMYGNVARYCPEMCSWYCWDEKMWRLDDANIVRDKYGIAVAQSFYEDASHVIDEKEANCLRAHSGRCESRRKLDNILNMAQSKCITRKSEMDQNLWLFNVQNGTIDLRTGMLKPHDSSDFITRIAPVEYAFDADVAKDAPRWSVFIDSIVCKRNDLAAYIQKMFGSALVGKVLDRHLYILYGASGFNGKTTLIEIIKGIMGAGYTSELPRAVIEDKKYSAGGVTPELAKMEGARFVTVSETKDLYRLAVDLIKQLVGGGRILVNPKYGTPFSFTPQATMCIETNRLPSVDGTDKALWSRLCPIPFDYEVPAEKVNLNLKSELLEEEAPVILKWMVDGALKWQAEGMVMPESVYQTYTAYRQESDPVGMFLESECVEVGEWNSVTTKVLYDGYIRFAKLYGYPEMQIRTFINRVSLPPREINGFLIERVTRIPGTMGGGWSKIQYMDGNPGLYPPETGEAGKVDEQGDEGLGGLL